MDEKQVLKNRILELTKEYAKKYLSNLENRDFKEGDRIPYSAKVYNEEEVINLVSSSLEFWLTEGHFYKEFEEKLKKYIGVKYLSYVNSGSSANLLAFYTLTSHLLGDKKLKKGDEVITVACGFPTTIAPIIQLGLVPVFVDVDIPTYNIDVNSLENAISEKTKAIFIAHTLGNPFDVQYIKQFCEKHNLFLIEDNCDALGSEAKVDGKYYKTGTFGDIATSSFYPPHHMTTGEGGAVYTNDALLNKIIRSNRDWGRDCVCPSGVDNTCNKRYEGEYGELPKGYDHKYVYSHFGFNLKSTDLQAAIGIPQIEKLDYFANEIYSNRHERRFNQIIEQLDYIKKNEEFIIFNDNLETCFKCFYRDISTFIKFIDLNIKIKQKILSKYIKYTSSFETLSDYKYILKFTNETLAKIEAQNLKLRNDAESKFSYYFHGKYNMHPIKILKTFLQNQIFTQKESFLLGISIGFMILLFLTCLVLGHNANLDIDEDPEFKSLFPEVFT